MKAAESKVRAAEKSLLAKLKGTAYTNEREFFHSKKRLANDEAIRIAKSASLRSESLPLMWKASVKAGKLLRAMHEYSDLLEQLRFHNNRLMDGLHLFENRLAAYAMTRPDPRYWDTRSKPYLEQAIDLHARLGEIYKIIRESRQPDFARLSGWVHVAERAARQLQRDFSADTALMADARAEKAKLSGFLKSEIEVIQTLQDFLLLWRDV